MKWELTRQAGEYLRSIHPQGDWILFWAFWVVFVSVAILIHQDGDK